MTNSSIHFKAGTRSSKLSRLQTRRALDECERRLPGLQFEMVFAETPGDRDRQTDLRHSPADFFSRDLDEALVAGRIDCALHSAKDLPEEGPAGIDRFWLPWREDPRDAVLLAEGRKEVPQGRFRIGISSDRREEYCARRFPEAEPASIRGAIGERLAQLDRGDYDMLIMAAAALHRLDLKERIVEYIPLSELRVPEGQGVLALTFRTGDDRFLALRNLLLPPVVLAGAGIGRADNVTVGVRRALRNCDVCLHDALLPEDVLEDLPPAATRIPVGKRSGRHSCGQDEICRLVISAAKKGSRVLRLKGGDPSVFGRLAEETEALQAEKLPFRVLPGIGALAAAAASTGILPSRRQTSRGFAVMTPRKAGSSAFNPLRPEERLRLPQILYMATTVLADLAAQYLDEGFPPSTPAALIYNAGSPEQQRVCGTLESIAEKAPARPGPGLVVIGDVANPDYAFQAHAALAGRRVMYCGAEQGSGKVRDAVDRYGGELVALPQIRLELTPWAAEALAACEQVDWLLLTSPACAKLFLDRYLAAGKDLRALPKVAVCGPGTAQVFQAQGIHPDLVPEIEFGAAGLAREFASLDLHGTRILRLRSDRARRELTQLLQAQGAEVEEVEFYHTKARHCEELPDAEILLFTSSSSVHAFLENFSPEALKDKTVCAIGQPTAETLRRCAGLAHPLVALEASLAGCVQTVAAWLSAETIKDKKESP